MSSYKNIAILCSGGDVSGMNAALKRFVEYSKKQGMTPFFVKNGYEGLIDNNIQVAKYSDVAGILSKGGTIIRTSRSKRFLEEKYREKALNNLRSLDISYVVVMGGDGSFKGMQKISEQCEDICFCGIPSTIDNDIFGTEYCLGVDTSLNIIKSSIDSIRDTASSFERAFVIETMGRNCGYLALVSALTSGAEMCLIPEIPYSLHKYEENFKKQMREGRKYFISVVSEALDCTNDLALWYKEDIGMDAHIMVLGHTQRGGNPTVHDRMMAFSFVSNAIDTLLSGEKSSVICYNNSEFKSKNVSEVSFKTFEIPEDLMLWGREYGEYV
ncbi:6-phosphofructokinase [hydrothermal vent metagenome]|uniref:6-phosphofructokinase n=1 Tax=hydrothermal vent metagenome TaxID=652676 RepID=A0A1W1EDG9_9ZZZZ